MRLKKRGKKWSINMNCRKIFGKLKQKYKKKISARINEKME